MVFRASFYHQPNLSFRNLRQTVGGSHLLSLRDVRQILNSRGQHPRAIANKIGCSRATVERCLAQPAKYIQRAARSDARLIELANQRPDPTPHIKPKNAVRCKGCGAKIIPPCVECENEKARQQAKLLARMAPKQ